MHVSVPAKPQHIAICVCTFQRPKLLAKCLDSLAAQHVDDSIRLTIVVIDNEAAPNNRAGVEAFTATCRFPVHYVHQPKPGIPAARNAALDKAMAVGADWIAMIDDDEAADPNWIAELMAPEWMRYPVLMGANIPVLPSPAPFWAIDKAAFDESDEGLALKTTCAGNVRFSVELLHAGLRFDERFGLTGGEDNDFFSRAHSAGFAIRRRYSAVTRELVHLERLTYRAQVYRAYWCAASDMRRYQMTRGILKAGAMKLLSIPSGYVFGCLWLAASPLAALFSRRLFKKWALRGGKTFGKASGRLVAMLGHYPQPYRVIHGS